MEDDKTDEQMRVPRNATRKSVSEQGETFEVAPTQGEVHVIVWQENGRAPIAGKMPYKIGTPRPDMALRQVIGTRGDVEHQEWLA